MAGSISTQADIVSVAFKSRFDQVGVVPGKDDGFVNRGERLPLGLQNRLGIARSPSWSGNIQVLT